MFFTDRFDAALRLIPLMKNFREKNAVIFAIPGGGVPIGYYLAKDYGFPLELVFAKKINNPVNGKPSVGAVTLTDQIIDERLNVPDVYIQNEVTRIRKALRSQCKLFAEDHISVPVEGKYAIIVDDGIASGNTMLSAIRMVKNMKPSKIAVVVPVAALEAAARIEKFVDDFVCLHTVNNVDVSINYLNFSKISDREIIQLRKAANRLESAA